MSLPVLSGDQRRILEFLLRHHPIEEMPPVFETRNTICGELRLALHEYDEACRDLTRLRLVVTDPPQAHDCDFLNLSAAGRRLLGHPPQPGGLAWGLLAALCQEGNKSGFTSAEHLQKVMGVEKSKTGQRSFALACQQLYDWGLLARREEGSQVFAFLMPTPAGRQAVDAATPEA